MMAEQRCEACKGRGWILGSTGECYEEIRRCDVCDSKYRNDVEAYEELVASMNRAKLLLVRDQDRRNMNGILEMLDQFKPMVLHQKDWEAKLRERRRET